MNIKVLSLALIMSITLTGCDTNSSNNKVGAKSNSSTSSTEIANTNPNATKYIMAVEAIYAPFAFKDEKGQVVGFDTDIIRAIGKKQGFDVEVISQPWTGIFDSLDNGSRDIVGSGVVWTAERAEKMNLSDPIIQSDKTAIYLGSRTDIQSFDDLKNKKVGVQGDSSYEKALRAYMGETSPAVIPYDSSFLPIQDVINGKIDAAFNNSNINDYYINTLSKKYNVNNLKTIKLPNSQPDNIIFAVKKGRDDLTKKINQGLVQIKQDGTYDQIYKKWFGTATQIQPTNIITSATSTTAPTK